MANVFAQQDTGGDNSGSGDFADGGEAGEADRTLGNTDDYDLGFLVNNVDKLHIQKDGNVGIGTTSPGAKLEVDGNVVADDPTEDTHLTTKSYVDGNVSDTAYNETTWSGITDVAPSKNAVRDEIELQARSILTTQGDTLYASAANTLTRLAKGAADTKLFMNATGTAPEWAGGIKLGTFTIDTATATGSQAISGVGFKPSHIILFIDIASTREFSVGFDDGTNHYSVNDNSASTANTYGTQVDWSMILYQSEGVNYLGLVSVLGADGFTVSWTKNGAKTGTATIFYLAFR